MKNLWWLVAGFGMAGAMAQLARWRRARGVPQAVDLNTCSREDLLQLPEIDAEMADRILEHRPYRSKFDLLNQLVVPDTIYRQVRSRIRVDDAAAHQPVQVAS